MIKNKKRLLVLFIIIAVATIAINNFYEIKKSKVLLAVYDKYNCNVVQANISTMSKLDGVLYTYEDMKIKAEEALYGLGIKNNVEVVQNENDSKKEYIVTKNAEDSETIIKVVSNKNDKQEIYETNIVINAVLYNKIDSIGYVQNLLDDFHQKQGLKDQMNITIVGSYNGDMDKNQKQALSDKIFKSLKAKKVDSFETDKIYSVYGYTSYIKESVVTNGKTINTNLAIRYNSYENKTYLYISSPIITTEF